MIAAAVKPFATVDAIREYVLAGRSTFTIVSRRSGERRTFQLTKAEPKPGADPMRSSPGYFARLLTGPDNTGDYRYLAFAYRTNGAWALKANKDGFGADAIKVLAWLLRQLETPSTLLEQAEVWHTGKCGRCARKLTVPESVASGIGPTCAAA